MMAYAETAPPLVIANCALQLLNLGSALLVFPAHGTTGPVSFYRSLPLLVYVDMASGHSLGAKEVNPVRQKKNSVRLTQHTHLSSPYSTVG